MMVELNSSLRLVYLLRSIVTSKNLKLAGAPIALNAIKSTKDCAIALMSPSLFYSKRLLILLKLASAKVYFVANSDT